MHVNHHIQRKHSLIHTHTHTKHEKKSIISDKMHVVDLYNYHTKVELKFKDFLKIKMRWKVYMKINF
jgi:hypothetical protein